MGQDRVETFGSELRRRRLAAGLSLNQMALGLHYSKGYLSKIETGSRPPSLALARRCDRILEAGGALLQALPPPGPPGPAGSAGPPWPPDPPGSSPPGPASTAEVGSDDWVLDLMMDGSSEAHLLRRRELLVGGAISLFGVTAGAPAMAAVAGMESTASSFAAMLHQLRIQGRAQPPALVLPTLVVQVHSLSTLAQAAAPAARDRLLLLASRFAEYTGWMVQESGDDRAMIWWTHQAVTYAKAAGDHELAAYAHVRHANAALYRGDGASTVDLAQRAYAQVTTGTGARSADPFGGDRIRALALQRQAQGHALLGRSDDCLRALDQARTLFDGLEPSDRPQRQAGDPPVLGTSADPSDLVLGWCLHDLGRSEDAVPVLERHLALIPATARRARARAGARLALAYTAVGDVVAACGITRQVLDDLDHVDSATVRHDLRAVAKGLSRWRAEPEVQRLSGGPLAAALRS